MVWCDEFESVLLRCPESKELYFQDLKLVPSSLFLHVPLRKLETLNVFCAFVDSAPLKFSLQVPTPLPPLSLSGLEVTDPQATPCSQFALQNIIARINPKRPASGRFRLDLTYCPITVVRALTPLTSYLTRVMITLKESEDISSYHELISGPSLDQILLFQVTDSSIRPTKRSSVSQHTCDSYRRQRHIDVESSMPNGRNSGQEMG